jgi:alpha-tubulin suppressor-like RCC1 family protein
VGLQGTQPCAVLADGAISCWPGLTESPVAGIPTATAVVAGSEFNCALLQDKTVWCWGTADIVRSVGGVPSEVAGIAGAKTVCAGDNHACATLEDGSVWCWGSNSFGVLGDGTQTARITPVRALGIETAL